MNEDMLFSTSWSREEIERGIQARDPWFYEYAFSNGARVTPQAPDALKIHADRTDAIFPHLDRLFAGRWDGVRCLDLACNEGWFSMQVARRGAASVLGIDVRSAHIEKSQWMAQASGMSRASLRTEDLFSFAGSSGEQYDLVLCLGLLYHLENPMGAVRVARQFTKNVCVIEGLVARSATMQAAKFGYAQPREGPGAIVLPADPVHCKETAGVAIIPSLPALHLMLCRAGFREVHLVMPPESASPTFQAYDRVILFAYV